MITTDEYKLTNIRYDHHRNGVCGAPFYVALFDWHDGEKVRHMQAILFPDGDCACAVLDVDEAAKGNIAFGENSWRGDHFIDTLREFIIKDSVKKFRERHGWKVTAAELRKEWNSWPRK